jgi:molybdate transport system ATP-binding protein
MLALNIRIERGGFGLDAHLAIPTPGVTALFGPSGAGKTTLAHAVAGLVTASGTIALDGETLLDTQRGICVPVEQRAIGCVFQDARLFPHLTVAGNLDYGLRRQRRVVYAQRDEVIALLGLASLLSRLPHQLSGGERQRVALGRALLGQPRLLVLDEPLASIDAARREDVLPYLEILRDRFCVPMLYVSHQYEEVLRLAAQVVLMDRGQIVATDTPAALSLSNALRSRVGTGGVGAVIETEVVAKNETEGLITVLLGGHALRLNASADAVGTRLRLHVLASDVILATERPHGLSVRNALPGEIEDLEAEENGMVLATVVIGSDRLLARITRSAVEDLALTTGRPVWALVKAASLNQGLYRPTAAANPAAP